jgi:dTDP-4-amino-4,6-dideoxygalactose transaminase
MSTKFPKGAYQNFRSGNLQRTVFRHLPPTAFPIEIRDITSGLYAMAQPQKSIRLFYEKMAAVADDRWCALVCSGRLALKMILTSLKRISPKRKVLIPAYGCSTILQSVLESELDPVFCDLSLDTLDFNYSEVTRKINNDFLAVIGVHLYGLAHDFHDLTSLSKKAGAYFIEDAAQSFGARIHGRQAGTQGDAGFLSLGKGKSLPAGGGGVIFATEEISRVVQEQYRSILLHPTPGFLHIPGVAVYMLAVNPFSWWFVSRSRFNPAMNGSDLSHLPPIRTKPISAFQAGVANSLLLRSEKVYAIWKENAAILSEGLSELEYLRVPKIFEDTEPVCLRFPIVIDNKLRTERIFARLHGAGIGVSRSYRFTLPGLLNRNGKQTGEDYPAAAHLSRCLITLPTHTWLNRHVINRVIEITHSEE